MGERPQIPLAARLTDDADWSAEPVDLSAVGKPLAKFSWLSPRTLWRSRNNVLVAFSGDPTETARAAWVHQQLARGVDPEFTIGRPELDDFNFMVMGDTGEGDRSQYSVVPAFLAASSDSEFTVIASDVVYPAGDINEYVGKFFVPYAKYPKPIYAIPGNHDWLDGLSGFMRHFCEAAPPAEKFRPPPSARWRRSAMLLHRVFWRRPRSLDPETLVRRHQLRPEARSEGPPQPNMYFAIDTPKLRIISIDTGILGRLDFAQGEWLRRVSAGPKPKLLISGKPIYAGPTMSPRRILAEDGSESGHAGLLWSIVRDPQNNYVAMISGDVHHYERHSVKLPEGRTMQCVISGGGGAFMTATHQIEKVARPDVDESSWVVYPTRADSLRAYSISLQRKLFRFLPGLSVFRPRGIPADQAAAIVSQRHGLDPEIEFARGEGSAGGGPVHVSLRSRVLASIVFPRRRLQWLPSEKASEALDWDAPPFFKNFMRVEVVGDELRLIAFGVTGLARDAESPAVIDRVTIPLDGGER
ncbi:MAG: metallophosphoesterase [Solirubrobacterales bacterium]